jgi:hypothetical protein
MQHVQRVVGMGADALFPHLYRVLRIADVVWDKSLPLGATGHIFPEVHLFERASGERSASGPVAPAGPERAHGLSLRALQLGSCRCPARCGRHGWR